MSQNIITADVVIVGAGIAGLWLHNRLSQLGYHCLLLENQKIGHAQTLSAQGIIHGGSKYALNGILSNAAQTISGMPARWKACLQGNGEIDYPASMCLPNINCSGPPKACRPRWCRFLPAKHCKAGCRIFPNQSTAVCLLTMVLKVRYTSWTNRCWMSAVYLKP